MFNDNGPTHVDSFSHLDPAPGAQTIDQMDLDLFHGTAVCLDVSHVAARTDITFDDVDLAEDEAGQRVTPGDIVLFHTGAYGRHAGDGRYLTDFPGLGESACEWIVERGVKTVGVLGEGTCVSHGDKVIGTNHVLPTREAARYTGGLWVGKYLKTVTYQEVTDEASSASLGGLCGRAARVGSFEGHARSGDVRLAKYTGAPLNWTTHTFDA